MKYSNRSGRQHFTQIVLAGMFLMGTAVVMADGLAGDYTSYPPLLSTQASGSKPNFLLMLDTSGSMMQDASGAWVGSEHETSRHVIARQAVAEIIKQYGSVANMGLMAFQPAPNNVYKSQTGGCYSPNLTTKEWCGQNLTDGSGKYVIRRGYLYIPIGSVNPLETSTDTVSRRNEFTRRLGTDVVSQPAPVSGFYNLFQTETTYYKDSVDYKTYRRLISDGGTPLEGTYVSALEYYKGTLSSSYYDSSITAAKAVWPTSMCDGKDVAILITDGLPTVTKEGDACNDCADAYTTKVEAQAKLLAAAGVPTYVIGFAVDSGSTAAGYLNRISAAGKTDDLGSETAYYANNLKDLKTALSAIFVDVIERVSSGTGAAVVTNKGQGLSADFQALYTPQKVVGGKVVEWVGSLQGFFLDENALIREDTNQNGLLDGYDVDRILEFNYYPSEKKYRVSRSLASASDPTVITSTIVSEVEDIAAIWNARDPLANLTNVLTQRPYAALASTGRRIYTSVDGKTLMDFSVIDPDNLSEADSREDEIRKTLAGLNSDLEDSEGFLSTSILEVKDELSLKVDPAFGDVLLEIDKLKKILGTKVTDLQAELDLRQAELDVQAGLLAEENQKVADAIAADNAADAAVVSAQAVLTTANSELATATTEYNDAVAAQTAAGTALASAQTTLNDKQSALITATSDLSTANGNQTTAQADRDAAYTANQTAQSNLTAANTALTQATTDAGLANDAVIARTTDVNNATTAHDNALTDLNAAESAYQAELNPQGDCLSTACQNALDARDAAALIESNTAQALADANAALTNANTAANTANSNLAAAQTAQTTAQGIADGTAATLATEEADLTAANTAQGTAQSTYDQALIERDAAQTAFNTASQNKIDADQAVIDTNATLATATTTQSNAQATLDAAILTAADTQTDLNDATAVRDAALIPYNAALDARDQAQADLTAALDKQSKAQLDFIAATNWMNAVSTAIAALRDELNRADAITGADLTTRNTLVGDLAATVQALIDLLANPPKDSNVALLSSLNDLLNIVEAQLAAVNGNVDSTGDGTLNSFNEWLVSVDGLMTSIEGKETALTTTLSDIQKMAHIRYMDDGIVGQTGDPDLTYTQRNEIVKWVRGEDVATLRNRTISFKTGQPEKVWRLPDIINSTPVVVGRPSESYYELYADDTYLDYINKKFNRRQMVYVGSNGGLLHAFNAGFWDDAKKGYVTRLDTDSTSTQHPLGAEVWSFIPKAALPHLQFVADPQYKHMFLVDGAPQAFDVNIFTPDDAHPNGWGTILVVTMRLGGGPFTVRVDEDGDGVDEDVVIRPSVMIFDVTDPEVEPTLIAELSDPQLGFTVGRPTVIKNRQRTGTTSFSSPSVNDWLLVFGSGPTDLYSATSGQRARMYAYDLSKKEWGWGGSSVELTLEEGAFTGDFAANDWDRDYIDDTVYFGLNSGNATSNDGQMVRLRLRSDQGESGWLNSKSVGTLVDVQRTVVARPAMQTDLFGRRWVSFGTGRLFAVDDNESVQQQYLYGVMEPLDSSTGELSYGSVSVSNLQDVDGVNVKVTGEVSNGPTGVSTINELQTYIQENKEGWRVPLTANGTDPSGRNFVRPTQQLNAVIFNEYTPSGDQCSPEGDTELYALNIMTGTVFPELYLDSYIAPNGDEYISQSVALVHGSYGEAVIVNGRLILHGSGGNVISYDYMSGTSTQLRRQSWRQIFNFGF